MLAQRQFLFVLLLSAFLGVVKAEQEWQPAAAPLMTRWGRLVSPTNAHLEYPRPQMVRERWFNLNGLWEYAITPQSASTPTEYDGWILVPFPVESALSGVGKTLTRKERLWYRREFKLPDDWHEQDVLLHFGAVDYEAVVWLNGRLVGKHRGGYDGFSFEVSPFLTRTGTNQLVVATWDPTDEAPYPRGKQSLLRPTGTYYTPCSGIWQTVWLEPVARQSIDSVKITPDVEREAFRVTVAGRNCSETDVVEIVVGAEGKPVAESTGAVDRAVTLPIPKPRLWSPEDPFLYDLEVNLIRGTNIIDSVQSYAGLRRISLGQDAAGRVRINLNGQPCFMLGLLDEGYWPDGLYTDPTDDATRREIENIRALGFNLIRKHVKVDSERWYYWADKLGVLVWQDMPSGDRTMSPEGRDLRRSEESAQAFERELEAMVSGRFNHPSIVVWVLFNQGWGQYETLRMTRMLKELDASRLVISASGGVDRGVGDIKSIHRYPLPDVLHPAPHRAIVVGEFGGLGLEIPGHMWATKSWAHLMMPDQQIMEDRYRLALEILAKRCEESGASAAVYTQVSDVESEATGLWTYDREVLKMKRKWILGMNRHLRTRLETGGH